MEPDTVFTEIADEVPEFGGAWVEGDAAIGEKETLHLWLTSPNVEARHESLRLLAERAGERFHQSNVVVHRADYSWRELDTWFRKGTEILKLPGASSLDIDERRNRIVLGLQDPDAQRGKIRQDLGDLGVPVDAVVVTSEEPEVMQRGEGQDKASANGEDEDRPAGADARQWIAIPAVVLGLAITAFVSWRLIKRHRR